MASLYYNPHREEDVICAYFLGEDACFSRTQIDDGTWFARSGQGEHSAYGDPLFLDAPGKDFHLTVGSPAVDTGTATWSPATDLEGRPRPSGGAPDIGPYECCAASRSRDLLFSITPLRPEGGMPPVG